MTAPNQVEDVLALHGWEAAGQTFCEGEATRTPLALDTGVRGLLYVWDDPVLAARAARAHELAGPEIFAVPERISSGLGWLVVQHPEGRPALEFLGDEAGRDLASLGDARAKEVVASLTNVLRKLHNLPAGGECGDVSEEPQGDSRFLTFSGWVAHHLEWFAEHSRRRDFPDEVVERLSKSIADMRHELSAFHPRTPPSLTHGKPSFRHVWLDDSGREVVALTGFDRAAFLPREVDLAHLLWIEGLASDDRFVRAIYQGYGAARTMDVQRRERFYRRLVAFAALFGMLGETMQSREDLVALTSAQALG